MSPKPGSFTVIAEVGSRPLDDARAPTRCACADPLPFAIRDTLSLPAGCSGLAFRELIQPTLTARASWTWTGLVKMNGIRDSTRVGETFHLDLDDAGIIASYDGGTTWSVVSGSDRTNAVTSFAFDQTRDYVLVSTYGRGLWRLTGH